MKTSVFNQMEWSSQDELEQAEKAIEDLACEWFDDGVCNFNFCFAVDEFLEDGPLSLFNVAQEVLAEMLDNDVELPEAFIMLNRAEQLWCVGCCIHKYGLLADWLFLEYGDEFDDRATYWPQKLRLTKKLRRELADAADRMDHLQS